MSLKSRREIDKRKKFKKARPVEDERSAKKKNKFVYKPRSYEEMRKQADRPIGRYDSPFKQSFDVWRAKQGDNLVRILPPTWEGADHYAYLVWMHRYVGNGSYSCPAMMLKKPCAICQAAQEASRQARDDEEKKEAYKLAAKPQMICWIIDREADNPYRPMIWSMSPKMDKEDILGLVLDNRKSIALAIDDPDQGRDLNLRRTGVGMTGTSYSGFKFDAEPSPLCDDPEKQEEILAFIADNPLPSTLQFYDNDHLRQVMEGTVEQRDEDLDEEEETVEEDEVDEEADDEAEEEEVEEEEVEEEEEEEEVEEETDEEETVDEDEEDEPPPRRKVGERPHVIAKDGKRIAQDDDETDEGEDEPPPRAAVRAGRRSGKLTRRR